MKRRVFNLVLIKPTRYDDDGYPIQWLRGSLPSNTLASVNGLALDCKERQVLGSDVDICITAIDETTRRVKPAKLIKMIKSGGAGGMVGFVGVQTNQWPRAMDISGPFLEADVPICIGGFHVTGCMAMLKEMPEEMVEAQEAGISFFLGEGEEQRLDEVIQDASAGKLKPLYDYRNRLPTLEEQPVPFLDGDVLAQSNSIWSSFDLGRGCPFECSFCCIINVQGRKSRFRTPDDLEQVIRKNHAIGITRFFITDDNFARNRNWEILCDRMIKLREEEGIDLRLIIQVDTKCHQTPNFIDKCARAGVDQVFIGLENINPDNLAATKKRQNKITDYRNMMLQWKKYSVVITAGYIIGFPNDTRESILQDIDIVKEELPVDILSMTVLTPLHGSEDHAKAVNEGVWIDPDLNKFDLTHMVTKHPNFADGEMDEVFREAYLRYYTPEHAYRVLKRAAALGSTKPMTAGNRLILYGWGSRFNNIFSLELGLLRLKYRHDRRSGMPLESRLNFYLSHWYNSLRAYAGMLYLKAYYTLLTRKLWRAPDRFAYTDTAITPYEEAEFDELEMYTHTRGGVEEVQRLQKIEKLKQQASQGAAEPAE